MSASSTLPAQLPVVPFTRPVSGRVTLPGSKSLTNRALLLAALCDGPVTLTGALFSEDSHLMAEALRALGFTVEASPGSATVHVEPGRAFQNPRPVELFVGLAGTAARFLTALCAAAPRGIYRIDGVPQMRKRPMKGLIEALRALGADIRCPGEEGFFPLEIHAAGLRGGPVEIDATESSQMLSALLMVAPLAAADLRIRLRGGVRWPFVRMTARLMAHFGQPEPTAAAGADDTVLAPAGHPYRCPEGRYAIEPDASAASYYLALPLVAAGSLTLEGLRGPGEGLQGDTAFIRVLADLGLATEATPAGLVVSAPAGAPASLRGAGERDFREFSDTFLTLAALTPLLPGPTLIKGIAHTRKQETDRVAGMAAELRRLGQDVVETEDSLAITPRPLKRDTVIQTYHDHRFAMSFAILGCHDLKGDGSPWLIIDNPACCAKTFPNFFDVLAGLRAVSAST